MVRESGLDANIKFLGYRRDVAALYRIANIYFQPSLIESHGISVLDAMQFGVPAVVSDAGGLPESVIEGETGFIVPVRDEVAMAQRLLTLGRDPALALRLGESSHARYQRHFSYSRWVHDVVRVHAELGVNLVPRPDDN